MARAGKRDNVRFIKGEDAVRARHGMGSYLHHDALFVRIRQDRPVHRFCAQGGQWPHGQGFRRRDRGLADASSAFSTSRAGTGYGSFKGFWTSRQPSRCNSMSSPRSSTPTTAPGLRSKTSFRTTASLTRSITNIRCATPTFSTLRAAAFANAHFCGVPKLEGAQRDMSSSQRFVDAIDDLYGQKKDLILMDNNVVASGTFQGDHCGDPRLGLHPRGKGATSPRRGVPCSAGSTSTRASMLASSAKIRMYLARTVHDMSSAAAHRVRSPRP